MKKFTEYQSMVIHLTPGMEEWFSVGTVITDGTVVANRIFFSDMMARIHLTSFADGSFRRPIEVKPFMFQYSEHRLMDEWRLSRRLVRAMLNAMQRLNLISLYSSKTYSIITVICVESVSVQGLGCVRNPFFRA